MPDRVTKLTDILVRTTKPPATGRLTITDTEVRGLSLRVSASGTRSWFMRYRPRGQAQRSVAIPGDYPTTSLAAARSRAQDILAAAKRGIDLIAEEKRQQAALTLAVSANSRTVRTLAADYVQMYCKNHQRRWKDVERRFKNHVLPKLGNRLLADLRRADIVELLDYLENKKGLRHQVNRVRSCLSAMFCWAVEREYMAENPTVGTRKRAVECERTRVLDDRELKAIWHALNDMPNPGKTFVQILMLTATRRDEAKRMKWDELDLEAGVWVLPAARTKSARELELPLSRQAIDLFNGLERKGPHVFTVSPDGKNAWGMETQFKKALDEKSGVTGWVFHDLRRTVRSRFAELRVPYEVAERLLNHAVPKIERTYNRHTYREEKATAMQAWADRLMAIVGSNVVSIRAHS